MGNLSKVLKVENGEVTQRCKNDEPFSRQELTSEIVRVENDLEEYRLGQRHIQPHELRLKEEYLVSLRNTLADFEGFWSWATNLEAK